VGGGVAAGAGAGAGAAQQHLRPARVGTACLCCTSWASCAEWARGGCRGVPGGAGLCQGLRPTAASCGQSATVDLHHDLQHLQQWICAPSPPRAPPLPLRPPLPQASTRASSPSGSTLPRGSTWQATPSCTSWRTASWWRPRAGCRPAPSPSVGGAGTPQHAAGQQRAQLLCGRAGPAPDQPGGASSACPDRSRGAPPQV
jgi:hypothetical protein